MESKTIIRAIFITILPTIDILLSLFDRVLKLLNKESINQSNLNRMENHTILSIISVIGTFAIVLYLLHKYDKVKKEMKVFNLINGYRNRARFFEKFDNLAYSRLPHETDEQFFKRLPQNQYNDELKKEYYVLKQKIIEELDINHSQAQQLLDNAYGINRKKQRKN